MLKTNLFVREIKETDIQLIINYWINSDDTFLRSMGADKSKLPSKKEWEQILSLQLSQTYTEKQSYCIIWLVNNIPVGHSNVNKIIFGKEAYMHLHLWNIANRKKGCGAEFVKLTLPYFFHNLKLKILYCEPYSNNPAPNKTLQKAGFEFIKEYITVPGSINFEQPVKLWKITFETFVTLEKKT